MHPCWTRLLQQPKPWLCVSGEQYIIYIAVGAFLVERKCLCVAISGIDIAEVSSDVISCPFQLTLLLEVHVIVRYVHMYNHV